MQENQKKTILRDSVGEPDPWEESLRIVFFLFFLFFFFFFFLFFGFWRIFVYYWRCFCIISFCTVFRYLLKGVFVGPSLGSLVLFPFVRFLFVQLFLLFVLCVCCLFLSVLLYVTNALTWTIKHTALPKKIESSKISRVPKFPYSQSRPNTQDMTSILKNYTLARIFQAIIPQ